MITKDCLDRVLPVVADSWERLRGCDVERLLSSIDFESNESLDQAAAIVRSVRPDLSGKIEEAVEFLTAEWGPAK